MDTLKAKIRKSIDDFNLSNCQLEGIVCECEPFGYSLEAFESLEELKNWIGIYILNIGDQIDELKKLESLLDKIQDEIIEMEEK